MSFKFGLNIKNKGAGGLGKPALGKKKPLFDDDGDDDVKVAAKPTDGAEEIAEFNFDESSVAAPQDTKPAPSVKPKNKLSGPPKRPLQAKEDDPSALGNAASTREAERKAQEAAQLDPSIYDFDAAYDALQARKLAKKAAEEEEVQQGRPKYMETLLESAETRKKDRLRARDKLLQREREAEGDEFADKAKFVTAAYKAQQEEARIAEAEEKIKQEAEEEKRKKEGMHGFHRLQLLEEEKRHREAQAAMEEAAEMVKKGVLPIRTEEPKEKSEVDIAKELSAQGKTVIINDEGQVADKRQLLSAGLNVIAKPKSAAAAAGASKRDTVPHTSYQSRNTGRGAGSKERQTAMIVEQIEQAAKRKADEEAEEQRKLEHASKSRKTQEDISSARERYLQRKREAAAAKAVGGR